MSGSFDLSKVGVGVKRIVRNASPAVLCELALATEDESALSSAGSLICYSGSKTGRSPKDKRIVRHPSSEQNIWWGDVNVELKPETFRLNKQRALDYFNTLERLYVVDGFAGWDQKFQVKVRIVCTRAYHALFMHNMLIRPTKEQLKTFGEPEYTIYNAGSFPANPYTEQMTSPTSVDLSFEDGEMVILGTEYAGEMKKGVFTIMNYIMVERGVLPMHCSANTDGKTGVSLFFGLSGTGKTTLSADDNRQLIGDDEHCWSDDGIFNIEGGCYAKVIGLSEEKEPQIYRALRFGTVLENVAYDHETREVLYNDKTITENTRASYPIDTIPNAVIPGVSGHPNHLIFLTCDAFGVLPPVSRLSPEQACYHFISGYTAKVAGTEMGVKEPEATFSACFGAAFMVWHPNTYAKLLWERMKQHKTTAWLVNTGWTGGDYHNSERIPLATSRAILDAIHDGTLLKSPVQTDPFFGFEVPTSCPNVDPKLLVPRETWASQERYDRAASDLVVRFQTNFKTYESMTDARIVAAGPKIPKGQAQAPS